MTILTMFIFTVSCGIVESPAGTIEGQIISENDSLQNTIEEQAGLAPDSMFIAEEYVDHHECVHFYGEFHSFGVLINHVGHEEFNEWLSDLNKICIEQHHSDCRFCCINIVQLIRDFNITREEMEHLMRTTRMYYQGHDLDVIFSDNDELIEKFYTTPPWEREKYNELRLRWAELTMKSGLLDFADESGTRRNYTGDNIRLFNIVEFVRRYDVPKDDFIELVYARLHHWGDFPEIQYNIDFIFSDDPRLDFMIAQGVDPAVIDRMYKTNDGIFRYALIYELTVAAINEGREITIAEVVRAIQIEQSFTITTPGLTYDQALNAVTFNTIQLSSGHTFPNSMFVEINRVSASGEKAYISSGTIMLNANGIGIHSLTSVAISAGEYVEILLYPDNDRTRIVTKLVVKPIVLEF